MRLGDRALGLRAGTVAVALLLAAIGFGSVSASHAQGPQDYRAQKKAAKGPVQPPRRGASGAPHVFPGRAAIPRPPLGAGAPPQNLRTAPAVTSPGFGAAPGGPRQALRPNAIGPANFGPNSRFGTQPGNRAFGNQPGNRTFGNRPGGFQPGNRNQPRGFTHRDPRMRAVNAATPQMRQVQRFSHRGEMLAIRARMPRFPLPGERNFTGIPPVSETRFVPVEMVCHWGDISPQRIEEIARQHNLTILATQRSGLTGGTLVHFRIDGNRAARDVVRAMEAQRIVSQPNYIYEAVQETAAAQSGAGTADQQYVATKLQLAEVHKIATGKDVMVAVIDSRIDEAHPELVKGIAERFDAVGKPDRPHTHGTGMAGAIVSQDRLMGVAPGARTLAIHAFSTETQQSPQATTKSIIAGLEWALNKGARIINMSFAGPYDPMLALALKRASEKGAILIAAVGNAGPKSPPLYPAADRHVIGVTAIDENDKLYQGANVGAQVAVAAPGVDVMVPAPAGAYQLTTGTSVAAAHVSGVAALLLEKHPQADAQLILEVLTASATRLGANKRDDRLGWGLVDPVAALSELDARLADTKVASTTPATPPPTTNPAVTPARAATNAAPTASTARSTLPRPGIYLPKQ